MGFIEIESANSYLPVVFQEAAMATPDLRPLSFGELLDRTFSLYRRHFWVFVGIMAIPQLFIVAWAMLWQSLQSFAPASRSGTSLVMGPGQMSGIMTGFFLGVLV
ncbi:MAG: hypothetical protein DMG23_04795, partial [Acidobacteria bacterium]